MQFTKNLNLKKPQEGDFIQISDINENMDVIDEKLGNKAQQEEGVKTEISGMSDKIGAGTDAAGTSSLFGKLNRLLADWPAARASKVDAVYEEICPANKNEADSSYGAKIHSKLNYLLGLMSDKNLSDTSSPFGRILTNTSANHTASKTGVLSQKHTYTHALLENTTYGLNAIKAGVMRGAVKSVHRGVVEPFDISTEIAITAVNPSKTLVNVGMFTTIGGTTNSTMFNSITYELSNSKLKLYAWSQADSAYSSNKTFVPLQYEIIEFY